jgi:hypothetical protein
MHNDSIQYPFKVKNGHRNSPFTDLFMFFSVRKLDNNLGENFVHCHCSRMQVVVIDMKLT